jgi:HK97 family phage major capsid protein
MHVTNRARLSGGASARGLMSVRADAGVPSMAEIKALIQEVNQTFSAMKASHEQQLAELKKGLADAVTADKMAKIDAALVEQQRALDDANRRLAAAQIGGAADPGDGPEVRQHKEAFNAWARRGVQAATQTSTYSDPAGGFLAPPTLDLAVTRVQAQMSSMRRLAQVQPISTGSFVRFKSIGGSTSGWVGETNTGATGRPQTDTPNLVRMEFTAGEIYAEPYATQQALDDMQVDVEAWLAGEVGIEFNEEEGSAFLTGNGVNKPKGLLDYAKVLNSSYSWGSVGYVKSGDANAFIAAGASSGPADCFIDTIYSLKAGYRANARWLMNDLTTARVRKFRDGDGNYLWQQSALAGQPSTFMGHAVETDDYMPDVAANAFPIAFGDFRQAYLIVDRVGIRVLRNPFKSNGLVAFYTTKRVGGGIQNFEAVKLIKNEA